MPDDQQLATQLIETFDLPVSSGVATALATAIADALIQARTEAFALGKQDVLKRLGRGDHQTITYG